MRPILFAAILAFLPLYAQAQDAPNILNLPAGEALLHISATERLEVAQDLLIATVRYETENRDSGTVQDEVNKAMKKALDLAEKHKEIKAETQHYNIHKTTIPRTKEQIWRGSQSLQLKSEDAETLLKLTGDLQELGFLTNGLHYSISPAKAAKIQDEMMEAALNKLTTRAQRAAQALGKSNATLVEVNVNGGHVPAPVSMYRGVHMEMAAMKTMDAAPPVASPGETKLTLTVSAKALLKP